MKDDFDVELETKCQACNGKGDDCAECKGAGWIPTKAGEKVLTLMQHYRQTLHATI